jgi:hypothetical protein
MVTNQDVLKLLTVKVWQAHENDEEITRPYGVGTNRQKQK